jgi:hypothetical protein
MGYVVQPGAEVASYAYAEKQDVGDAREPFRRHVGAEALLASRRFN